MWEEEYSTALERVKGCMYTGMILVNAVLERQLLIVGVKPSFRWIILGANEMNLSSASRLSFARMEFLVNI